MRAPGCAARSSGWASECDHACVAQLVEHFLGKEEVTGSIPVASSALKNIRQENTEATTCETSLHWNALIASDATTPRRRTRRNRRDEWSIRSTVGSAGNTPLTKRPGDRSREGAAPAFMIAEGLQRGGRGTIMAVSPIESCQDIESRPPESSPCPFITCDAEYVTGVHLRGR